MTDSLTVYLSGDGFKGSGDAFNGDAEATISINGVPTSGVRDVAAVQASDVAQAFTFTGNFGPAPQVALSFINDFYNGPGQDINLYLNGFSYDGVPQLGLKQEVGYDETVRYTLASTAAPALRASGFLNSLGVDLHLNYPDTPESNVQTDAASLAYLGVTRITGGVPTAQTLPAIQALAADGVKFAIIMPAASTDALLPQQLAAVDALGNSVAAIVGPNEVNLSSDFSWDGQNGDAAEVAYQKALYADVKADPKLAGVPVYGFSVAAVGADFYQTLGSIAPYEDYGNMHVYFPSAQPPASVLQYVEGVTSISSPGRPLIISETNYTTAPLITGAVSDAVQGRYDLDLLMDAAKTGVAITYLYELLDQQPDPQDTNGENHFGLFNNDGTPKPSATGIHNLGVILGDAGASATSFTTAPLAYSVTGLPASGNSLAYEKSDGTYDLVVWAEPEIWSTTTGFITAPSLPVQVTLGAQYAGVTVFDPLAGTSPLAQYANASSVQVTVTDHPVIIQLTAAPLAPTPVVLGQGPDTLTLLVSEDAFLGNALFSVSVDGALVGAVQAATASHAAGALQEFDVKGNFGPGTHQASVTFLNDLYTAGVGDRNLYVASATFDGAAVAGSALGLYSSGTQSFGFTGAPPAPTIVDPGQGPDQLALFMSEDAFQGDAQFTVAVDGTQVGGVQTVTTSHSAKASQEFDVLGRFGIGPHQVGVTFLNDAYTPGVGDRNLYLTSASIDGTAVAGSSLNLYSAGTQSTPFGGVAIAPTVLGQGPNDIALFLSEDAYNGDAQFTIAVDGTQYGGVQTVNPTALHGIGLPQEFDVLGSFDASPHKVSITFLNDAYTPGVGDRNLYLDLATIDGTRPATGLPLYLNTYGTQSVTIQLPPH